MSYEITLIFGFSIIIPVVISWIRFKQINPAYYPFIFCLWLGLLNETLSYISSKISHNNTVNSNIYVLLESFLITWQFYNWKLFTRLKSLYIIILCLLAGVWIAENFIIAKITSICSYFRITYSFIIVLMSISAVNMLLVRERRSMLTNPIFLLCITFIIYYTYNALVETFWIYGLNSTDKFRIKVYLIKIFVNLFANLAYTLSVIWIPTKQRFTLPS